MAAGALLIAGALAQPLLTASANTRPAQTTAPDRRTITVVGVGRASAAPDIARVTLGMDVVNAKLSTALTEVNKKTADIMAALEKAGVAKQDIRTAEFNVIPQQAYGPTGPGPITGYRVINTVRVTVRDLEQAGAVLDAAVNAGANTIQGLTFTIEDIRPTEAEARKDAMADAKSKADALAVEAGAKVGQVLTISEVISGGPIPLMQMNALAVPAPVGGGGVEVAPGMQDVNAQVQVVYEIE